MTDERLYRADHLIPEAAPNPATGQALGSIGSRYMVPAATLATVEAAKIAAAGGDLALVSMLGNTQRTWWKDTMQRHRHLEAVGQRSLAAARRGFERHRCHRHLAGLELDQPAGHQHRQHRCGRDGRQCACGCGHRRGCDCRCGPGYSRCCRHGHCHGRCHVCQLAGRCRWRRLDTHTSRHRCRLLQRSQVATPAA